MPRFHTRFELVGRPPSRRDWLGLGISAVLGRPGLGRAAPPSASSLPGFGRAKSVLVVFTSGGQSQLDTWDPKPDAPAEVRGAFGTIPTSVPGVRVCEHLPRLAALQHRVTVLRSMTHDDLDHGSACYLALTGRPHPRKSSNPEPKGTDAPALGAVLPRIRPDRRFPHSAFHVNGPLLTPSEPGPGQYGGVLGRGYDPLDLGDVTDGTALLTGMSPRPDLPAERLDERSDLAHRLDAVTRAGDRLPAADGQRALVRQAYELLHTPRVRDAFDLAREPARVRDGYGRVRAGQACLMGRRLAQDGVAWGTALI